MKLRIVSSRGEIEALNTREKMVHLAFRASNVDFLNLMQKCPGLRAIQVPPSYLKTMSAAIKGFLEMQGIELLAGDVWGHRKDIDEYFTVPETALDRIRAMSQKGAPAQEIANEVQKEARLGEDLVKFIARVEATA
jgi:hypothetical protein